MLSVPRPAGLVDYAAGVNVPLAVLRWGDRLGEERESNLAILEERLSVGAGHPGAGQPE